MMSLLHLFLDSTEIALASSFTLLFLDYYNLLMIVLIFLLGLHSLDLSPYY